MNTVTGRLVSGWAFGALCLALLGCSAGNPAVGLPPATEPVQTSYTLQPGDQLRIVVFGQENVPTDYAVNDEGYLSMPLVGAVEAKGKSVPELEAHLAQEFTRVLVDPSVSVQLIAPRPVYVLGGINEPGAYPYAKDMTIMSAAAMANGFTPYAYQDYFQVTRAGADGKQLDFRATGRDLVQPNDIIYVYEQYKEY